MITVQHKSFRPHTAAISRTAVLMVVFMSAAVILLMPLRAHAGATAPQVIAPPAYDTASLPASRCSDIPPVSMSGQNGSIDVPSAVIQQGTASVAVYNTYASQNNLLGSGTTFDNDTMYGAFSYAPLGNLELSIDSLYSSSTIGSRSLHYSGDLRIGVKAGVQVLPGLSVAGLGEVLTYSKTGSTGTGGYNGAATSYTLSFLASYDLQDSAVSFPLIINLRAGYLWDNTGSLLQSDAVHFIPPAGKYAMGIRGDNQTLLGCSLLFPLPRYSIEPMLEFTAQFAGAYSSYAVNDSAYSSVSFDQNPVSLTPGIIFYTPVHGLRVALAASLSLARSLNQAAGPAPVTPQTVWIAGLSYSL